MNQSDYLIHYGVLGMKWGVRRYQNRDGSYTSLGRLRYNKGSSNSQRKARRNEKLLIRGEQIYDSGGKERKKQYIKNTALPLIAGAITLIGIGQSSLNTPAIKALTCGILGMDAAIIGKTWYDMTALDKYTKSIKK